MCLCFKPVSGALSQYKDFFHVRDLHFKDNTALRPPYLYNARLIPGLHPANERRRYKVTPSLIGWAQT